MRSFHARGVVLALGLALAAGTAQGNDPLGQPSLLPLPPVEMPVRQVVHRGMFDQGEPSPAPPVVESLPSPSDHGVPAEQTIISPEYHGAMTKEWAPSDVGCVDGVCGVGCACPNTWYGSANGLFMARDARRGFNCAIDTGTNDVVLSNCGHLRGKWGGGFEVSLGRTLNCCQNAIEVTYWGLYPAEEGQEAWGSDMVGDLNTTLNFRDLDYDDGNGTTGQVQDWFEGSQRQSVFAQYSVHSVEVNLLGQTCGGGIFGCGPYGPCANGCGPALNFGWSAGIRYFQFNEDFAYGTDEWDTDWTGDGGELWYESQTTNNLLGFQLGGTLGYRFCSCWQLYMNGKAGVYGNHATNRQQVYGGNGYATINNGGWTGEDYYLNSSNTDLAMLAQFDLGARWQISRCWSARFGYRVVGVSGVALVGHQVPTDFSNVDVISDIDTNGTLLLHGGYAGLEFCF